VNNQTTSDTVFVTVTAPTTSNPTSTAIPAFELAVVLANMIIIVAMITAKRKQKK